MGTLRSYGELAAMHRTEIEPDRAIADLDREFRRFRVQMGFFEAAVAERLGMNRTDLHVITLLHDAGSMTAGEIAQATNLTTGAVTAVIDRLESGGWAQRERDPSDRRRVVVKLALDRRRQIAQVFQPMLRRSAEIYSDLRDTDRAVLLEFLRKAYPMLHKETAKLRAKPEVGAAAAASGRDIALPLGAATRGGLQVVSGAARLHLHAELSMPELLRARFEGRVPSVRQDGGTVTIAYTRFRAVQRRGETADVALNGAIPWDIHIRGGVSQLTADLAALPLGSLEVAGGASDVAVSLPPPTGTVRVSFSGGASKLFLHRPRGVAARLQVSGGVGKLAFDAQRLGAVGGETRLESPDYATAEDRYEILISGGTSQLALNAPETGSA
jgi:DNA-binding MarR family transcriptional regulator